ncbi:hypothetical protein [uncultured Sphaerochaeta sp.]|uniref:hypothetical protein n=1 Tax=uncultured Sphaerochaeta sp. TaxID=886478 RepID=UPI0029CA87C9|nr:hypothetical protein [uncultured Sphaerochaeta sp.]
MRNRSKQQRTYNRLSIFLIGALVVLSLFASCSTSQGGSVHISLDRSLVREAGPQSPDLDLEIASYELTLYGPERTTIIMERTLSAEVQQTTFDTLPTGSWKLRVQAKNTEGKIVRSLGYDNALGDRLIAFEVRRGEVSVVDCTLVPYWVGEGDLSLSLDWSLVDLDLLSTKPGLAVSITPLSEVSSLQGVQVATPLGGYAITSQEADDALSVELSPENGILPDGREIQLALSALPAGLYEISVELCTEASSVRLWKGVRFASVMEGGTISLDISLLDPNLQTGSITFPIEEHLDALGVSFTSTAPSTLDPGQKGEFTVAVTGQGSESSLSYAWYVNGEKVESETETETETEGDSETENDEVFPEILLYSFTEAGQYTITSSVTEEDSGGNLTNWGMAQWELTVEQGEVD